MTAAPVDIGCAASEHDEMAVWDVYMATGTQIDSYHTRGDEVCYSASEVSLYRVNVSLCKTADAWNGPRPLRSRYRSYPPRPLDHHHQHLQVS